MTPAIGIEIKIPNKLAIIAPISKAKNMTTGFKLSVFCITIGAIKLS